MEFNPYHHWLGVPAELAAPNHYELLGLRWGEKSDELIRWAADQCARRVEPLLAGEQGLLARRILEQIAAARQCLLDPQAKADYDRRLGAGAAVGDRGGGPAMNGVARSSLHEVGRVSRADHPLPPHATPPRRADGPPSGPDLESSAVPVAPRPARDVVHPAPRVTLEGSAAAPPKMLAPLADEVPPLRVPMMSKLALDGILAELAHAMQECRQLYLSCVSPSPGFQQAAAQQLAISQDRLHRGLLAKVYATIAEADDRWTYEEQRCAAALLQHVGVAWAPDRLEETARKVARQAAKLDWQRLLAPFRENPELRVRTAELETVVARVANLIAKADGFVAPSEISVLHAIGEELRSERPASAAGGPATVAVEPPVPWEPDKLPRRAKRVRIAPAQQREQSLRHLDALVGLQQIKQEIRELADWGFLQHQRRQTGLPYEPPDLRFIFLGRAGTGKTQVARVMSEVLLAGGVLKRGHVVELSGFDLVSRDPHDAAEVTKAKLRQAMGGTLVVEYAGALFSAGESSATGVLRVLRQNLVAHAGRLAVVLSDHSEHLLSLLDRHAEWASLFRRQWEFADYRAGELGQIFQYFCDCNQYRVTRLAQIKLLLLFDWQLHRDGERFGYGHGVRRVFGRAVHRLAGRIAGVSPLTKELLTTFHDGDIALDGVPAQAIGSLADPRRTFTVYCPGCASVNVVGPELLGIRVECIRCRHRFVCAWGDPAQ